MPHYQRYVDTLRAREHHDNVIDYTELRILRIIERLPAAKKREMSQRLMEYRKHKWTVCWIDGIPVFEPTSSER